MRTVACMAGAALLAAAPARAGVIRFDDAWADIRNYSSPANYYRPTHGMTISGGQPRVWGGNGNGNVGNWYLEGTNGSAFLGCNQDACFAQRFSFDQVLLRLSIDLGTPGYADNAGAYEVQAWMGDVLVQTSSHTVSSSGNPGNWATAVLQGRFDAVQVVYTPLSPMFRGYGLDNIVYEAERTVTEPSSLALAGLALLAALQVRPRRA